MSVSLFVKTCVIALLIFANEVFMNPILREDDKFTLRIVHTNDMHARFEETSQLSTACTPQDSKAGKCYGGFARIATLVRQARSESPSTLFLNAGDTYQGTAWYNVYKWRAVSVFLNLLAPDAISLGNHEFDDGVAGLIPFIQNATFPIVTANLDLSEQPDLAATNLKNSTVLEVNGRKIGVIGYLTPETKILSTTEKVIFKDEVEAIRKEVTKLREQGVDILIALGHSGFETDKRIAREVENIDLVIGGHTNTFLYRGRQPDVEVPEGFYPTEVRQKNGRKVYVVQAYAYTKYLGNFSASFDVKGEITHIEGNPILVDSSVMEAEDVREMIRSMRKPIDDLEHEVVGKTRVFLDGDSKNCRRRECNMGNLICDALIDHYVVENLSENGWTDVAIAVQNSGSIRSSITRARNDEVTRSDIISVLPFGNVVVKASMTGEQILSMLEWSVHNLNDTTSTGNLFGAYLQYSGLQVAYNISQPPNSRVVSVQLRCAACRVPIYSELQKNATYTVLLNDFLAKGGDGFHMLENLETTSFGVTTADALEQYFKRHSPVYPGVEWRIAYIDTETKKNISKVSRSFNSHNLGTTYQPAVNVMTLLPIIVWLMRP
ncbi:protein 5NUC-like [Pseudomyrmex gracilis]|uniref:protein 5NUC-like n=1 Tax=Pseudomyrmex gracilis TaxID=219809 RepID=UPI0009955E4A|nr:protein 5NUC-like [Pseudomyrmex gracilis]XP_020284110.1 protein 5NUC-like [Pseudomyrmex gracilis]XP_020284111.1 protein 5NUC-like [Pseudomyrmex gracilis]XP_020284112.1 protein 5NUC-like [Pseudomyrmex gracilis]XP_020284113.1 protein 5NUC-like [Pseudomyrmex gracilis]XP_020284114.1 protein 5NUC-like [Pseudomyrmex gracilis]XP_020284115.1 protein 5NUC-like [Pseudomyrmex gracilis]XP_020284116.1 protein 5NUC-like [Pseudomyrmex gracilis]